jgi:hypothetical protein
MKASNCKAENYGEKVFLLKTNGKLFVAHAAMTYATTALR